MEVLDDVSVAENSQNEVLKRLKEKNNRLLEDFIVSKMEKARVEEMLLKREIAIKAVTLFSGSGKECDLSEDK